MKTVRQMIWSRVLPGLFLLFPLFGFTEINIGVNNQVNTGTIVGGNCTQGNGETRQEKRKLSSFDEIIVDGIFEVRVICGGKEQTVVVTADSNLHSAITATVRKRTLVISTSGAICTENPMILDIAMEELKSLMVEGSSELLVTSRNCTTDAFSLDLRGTSSMKLIGGGKTIDIQLQGTAELDGSEFQAEHVTINAEDATEATIYVTGTLSGNTSGTSEITYSGNPRKVHVQTSDVSEIIPSE